MQQQWDRVEAPECFGPIDGGTGALVHGLRLLSTATFSRFRQEHHTTSGSKAPRH
jgi:hypothetical protein